MFVVADVEKGKAGTKVRRLSRISWLIMKMRSCSVPLRSLGYYSTDIALQLT